MEPLSLSYWLQLASAAFLLVAVWHGAALVKRGRPGWKSWLMLTLALGLMAQQAIAGISWLLATGIYDLGRAVVGMVSAILLAWGFAGLRRDRERGPDDESSPPR